MVSFGEKAKIKKAGNLNLGRSYVITTVPVYLKVGKSQKEFVVSSNIPKKNNIFSCFLSKGSENGSNQNVKAIYYVKGQLISKANCQAVNSSKKGTNEFVFTTMQRVFVRFLEEIEDTDQKYISKLSDL